MDEHEQTIRQVVGAYQAAVNAKDVDAFVSLYDPAVVIFDMWGEWSYTGVEAWRKMVTDWFGSLGNDRVIVEANHIQSNAENNLAVVHAFVIFKGLSAAGEVLRAMQNRFTWVLQRRDGAWRIIHEHSSAPVDFETSKVILKPQ